MIIDWIKENKITKDYEQELEPAVKRFLNQRNAIRGIYDTPGYKEIIRWLKVEQTTAMNAVLLSKENRIEEKARYSAANRLLLFLENLVNSPKAEL